MKATLRMVRFLVCPNCDERVGAIDHLAVGQEFGPWNCKNDVCHTAITGTVTADGADIETCKRDTVRGFALLKFRDLYLVVNAVNIGSGQDYFYHSHQCPTNLLGSVEEVFDSEGIDPHGTMRFVADIPWTPEAEDRLGEADTLQDLFALFKTDGKPAPTKWPEGERGVMPIGTKARPS